MKRKFPDLPIVGVGGVIFEGDRVLLVKRGKEPGLGQWSIPGGVVQVGETLKEAVVREVREETHLEVEALGLAKVLERIFRDPDGRVAYHYVLVDFLCRRLGGTVQADSDAQEASWVPLRDLHSYQVVSTAREVIHRADWLRKNPEAEVPPPGIARAYD
jgi:8-oxo-dGTP diphosphatase